MMQNVVTIKGREDLFVWLYELGDPELSNE